MFPGEMMGIPNAASQIAIPSVPNNLNRTLFEHMRAMRYLNAMGRMGGYGGGRGSYGRGMGPMDLSQGPNPGTMDPQMVNSVLGQYGESLPDNPSPYGILPNSGFFGDHQRIGGALESAMFAGANVGPSDTVGEGIQNAMRGIIGGQTERARAVNQQFMQPFQTAGMIEQLQQQGANLEDLRSQGRLRDAQARYYNDKPSLDQEKISAQEQTNLLREQANMYRLQNQSAQREMQMSHLSQPVRDELAAKGINPWEATPAQINTALTAVKNYQQGLRAIGPNINAAASDKRQGTGESFTDSQRVARSNYLHEGDTKAMASYIQNGGTVEGWGSYVEQHNNHVDNWVEARRNGDKRTLQEYSSSGSPMPMGGGLGASSSAPGGGSNAADQAIMDWQRQRQMRNQAQQGVANAPRFADNPPNSGPNPGFQIPPVMNIPGTMIPTGSPMPGVQYNYFNNR